MKEVNEKLAAIKLYYPSLRICQIISNAVYLSTKRRDVFYATDEELNEGLSLYIKKLIKMNDGKIDNS